MEVKHFAKELIMTTPNIRKYKLKDFPIFVMEITQAPYKDYYKLTTDEILMVFEHIEIIREIKNLTICHYKQPAIQAFVQNELDEKQKIKFKGDIQLFTSDLQDSSDRAKKEFIDTPRKQCLWVLLHEIGHIVDKSQEKREQVADDYANKTFADIYGKIINDYKEV
jgi:hypothetical protein